MNKFKKETLIINQLQVLTYLLSQLYSQSSIGFAKDDLIKQTEDKISQLINKINE